jgi:hypothetical protein
MACIPSPSAPEGSECQGRLMATDEEPQDSQEQDEKPYVRMKREDIRALEEAASKAKDLERMQKELVFAKAGIDTDSKLGKMLLQTYDGELTKEALIAEAQEIGLIEAQTEAPEVTKEEKAGTRERQALSNGATPPGENPVHPKQEAVDAAKRVIEEGGKYDHAAGAYVSTLVQRYADGDERAARNPSDRFRRSS